MKNYSVGAKAWVVFFLGASFFFLMYVARIAPSVMSLELMHDFHVNAIVISSISLFYFYPYISMQMPVGVLIDRFGPRLLLTLMTLLCAIAIFMFSIAESVVLLKLSRFLFGFAAAFAFVGALKLAAEWFPPYRIGLLAGLVQALGMFGGYLGQQPLAIGVDHIGWRASLLVVASLFLVLSFLIAVIVRNQPPHSPWLEMGSSPAAAKGKAMLQGLTAVLKNPQTWLTGVYAGLLYAPTAAFADCGGILFYAKYIILILQKQRRGLVLFF